MEWKYLVKPIYFTDACKVYNMTEDKLIELIENPRIKPDKKYCPLGIFAEPKFPWIPAADDHESMRACYDNVSAYTCIQLDFDNGYSVDQFIEEHDFRYYLYTSYNNGYKDNERFRVIVPLNEPLQQDIMGPGYVDYMMYKFPNCDRSCFDRAHFQLIPAVRPDGGIDHYRYKINDTSKLFSINTDAVKASDRAHREKYDHLRWFEEAHQKWINELYGERPDDEERRIQNQLRKAQSLIDAAVVGNRHNTCLQVASYLKRKGLLDYKHVIDPPMDCVEEWRKVINQSDFC